MKINKNSRYKQICKWLYIFVIFSIVSSIIIYVFSKNINYIPIWLIIILILCLCNILFMDSRIADIHLYDNYFHLITLFKNIKINYEDFNIYYIERQNYNPRFVIHTKNKKYWIAYTEYNYNNLKILLIKTKSKFSLNNFEKSFEKIYLKPDFFDL